MDVERELVVKAIITGQADRLMIAGFDSSHFVSQDVRDVWDFVISHTRQYRTSPSVDVVKAKHPNFNLVSHTTEPVQYLVDQMHVEVKRRTAQRHLLELATMLKDQNAIKDIDRLFMERARMMMAEIPHSAEARFSEMHSRIDEYVARKASGQVGRGIGMGIPTIDNETSGIQPHDYITIAGWQGTGKSTLLQHILFSAWKQGKRALLLPLEMEAPALMRRFDTMKLNWEYRKLKEMNLTDDEIKEWQNTADEVEKSQGDIIVVDHVGRCTVDDVFAHIERTKPDLVAIDYITLMTPPSQGSQMWEKITYLTRDLKQICRTSKTPIIGVAQTNRESVRDPNGPALQNIAYSSSIGQDSDVVLTLNRTEEMKANDQMEVRLTKNRDGRNVVVKMYWDMERMEFREWNMSDEFKIRLDDPDDVVISGAATGDSVNNPKPSGE